MSLETHGSEVAAVAGKAPLGLTVTSAVLLGVSLQDWVLIATLIFTVLQIAALIYKFLKNRGDDDVG